MPGLPNPSIARSSSGSVSERSVPDAQHEPTSSELAEIVHTVAAEGEHRFTYAVVVTLLVAAACLLYFTIAQSAALFGRGISVAEAAFNRGDADPTAMTHRIFILALAHEIVTFKAVALFVGAMTTVLGALFVLRNAQVPYRASIQGSAWRFSLGTSSPGLVMISFGCALVAVAILSSAEIKDSIVTREDRQPAEVAAVEEDTADYVVRAESYARQAQTTDGGVNQEENSP